ncbi:hypothetical protein TREES_T100000127 [Tupaia chinensis]|uniref:Uncharacterized protein n=1 Tax=Tupaia chinensis TaxID=246437 RepID=L9LDA9_TUPCH|nr:hypothetical protein TREES_T100000127 [Tupaia chinensis]
MPRWNQYYLVIGSARDLLENIAVGVRPRMGMVTRKITLMILSVISDNNSTVNSVLSLMLPFHSHVSS